MRNKPDTFPTKQVIIGGLLIGAGAAILMSGLAISGSAVAAAVREPAAAAMRRTWAQTRAATTAGARAWQDETARQRAAA